MAGSYFNSSSSRLLSLLAAALAVGALYFAKAIFLPLAVAALISFVLAPWADRLERFRLPRAASTAVMVALAFLVIGLIGWAVTDQAVQVSSQLPQYKQNLVDKIRDLRPQSNGSVARAAKTLEELGWELRGSSKPAAPADSTAAAAPQTLPPAPQISAAAGAKDTAAAGAKDTAAAGAKDTAAVGAKDTAPVGGKDQVLPVRVVSMPASTTSLAEVWSVIEPIFAPLANLAVIVVLVAFILMRREDLRNRMIEVAGRSDLRASTEAISDAAQRVSRYLRSALLINAIYGVAIAVGLSIIGLPNPLLWGVLALVLRFLPYLGPWIGAAMPIVLSLVVFDGWQQPMSIVGLFIVAELIVNLVLEPWLYSSGTGLSPLGVILAAMLWTWLWGPVGLVVAVPLTVCLVVVANHVPQLRFVGVLLGDQPTMSSSELIYQRLLALDEEEAGQLARAAAGQTLLPTFYDEVLLPTLCLAQRDRETGRLDEQRFSLVTDGLRDLAEDATTASPPAEEASDLADAPIQSRARILCVSACGLPCEVAALMVKQTLTRQGLSVELGATELLANELVERVGDDICDAVVISVLPPAAIRGGRYLLKKLRQAHPDLPIIIGLWQGEHFVKARERFEADGATAIVGSIREAARAVRQIAIRLPLEPVAELPPPIVMAPARPTPVPR